MKHRFARGGFTLIELLLVIGIIAILAAIVIVAINPTRQLGQARDANRRSDINTLLNAVYQYAIDNNGSLPPAIPTTLAVVDSAHEICLQGSTTGCGVDINTLTDQGKYLVGIPRDPNKFGSSDGVGAEAGTNYFIGKDPNGRITVISVTEQNGTISVTR